MIFKLLDRLEAYLGKQRALRAQGTKDAQLSASSRLQKNLIIPTEKEIMNDQIARRMQAEKDSQGVSGFSGSAYNGPGNVDHAKIRSNKNQRHQ
jgi:hypothetical protein